MYSKGEVIFVICVFIFVFCCFSIPIILYVTDDVTSNLNLAEIAEIKVDNCPSQQVIKYFNHAFIDSTIEMLATT